MSMSYPNLEPRWMTYGRSVAVMLPAISVWVAFCVFVLPKLKQICAASGMPLWGTAVVALNVSDFAKSHLIAIALVTAAILALLEWRWSRWARYRRLVFGLAAYGLNMAVLLLLAVLAILAVAAGAHLAGK